MYLLKILSSLDNRWFHFPERLPRTFSILEKKNQLSKSLSQESSKKQIFQKAKMITHTQGIFNKLTFKKTNISEE